MKQKVLIVKLGFTETMDHRISLDNISLDDIFIPEKTLDFLP